MPAPAAFQGSYTDIRFVKTRKVCQIIVELPIEAGAAFVAAFGAPNPATDCPVALARINPSKTADKPASEAPAQDNGPAQKLSRRFRDLPYAQQAAMRCHEPAFKLFLVEQCKELPSSDPADYVRAVCKVQSRSEIVKGSKAGNLWEIVESAFVAWKAVA